jgi:hypothetical protein
MGTDGKMYEMFLARFTPERPLIADVVKQWRFRDLKPFYVMKPEQQ